MRTDDLIDALAGDVRPAPPDQVPRRIAASAAVGGLAALAAVFFWLGLRADLPEAVGGMMFWMKAGYATVLAAAGFWCAERLARPIGSARSGVILAAAVVAILLAIGVANLMLAAPADRMTLWLGGSWRRCPVNILVLSLPTLALALVVMRRFAPTRLALAGGAAGLFSGGLAALIYGLHCPETAPAFLATWYTLGVLFSTGLGAALGPLVLRWR